MNKILILASKSPRRRKIFKELGLKYKVISSKLPESSNKKRVSSYVKDLALLKVREVSSQVKEGIIFGADTVVVCAGKILGKPKDLKHAKEILREITAKPHYVYTGIAVMDLYNKKIFLDYEKTKVIMRKFSEYEINKFAVKHLDKAGAYGIQSEKDNMVDKIYGDYYNVVGLPVKKAKKLLAKCGIKIDKSKLKRFCCYKDK